MKTPETSAPGKRSVFALLAGPLLLVLASSAQADICRVTTDGTGSGDGSDWTGQAMDLHTALDADNCAEIWVKAGVHKPVEPANPGNVTEAEREAFYLIARQVEIYGGFAGGELDREARDPVSNLTILSGDIDGNDTVNADGVTEVAGHIAGDNSYRIVGAAGITTSTVIDGFVITGGLANHTDPISYFNRGGGMLCGSGSSGVPCSPVISNVSFLGNLASTGGGLMNIASGGGTSSPVLSNVTFSGNSANAAGAMASVAFSNESVSNPVLNNVTFNGNSALVVGGAMANATNDGTVAPTLNNVTFSGNSADMGGAIFNEGPVISELNNSILYGNSASTAGDEIFLQDGATFILNHSIVKGGCPSGGSCNNVTGADPLLGSLAHNGGFTMTMLPDLEGAAIDAGDPAACPDEDQRGVSRPRGAGCDIGAVELIQSALTVEAGGEGLVDAGPGPSPVGGGIMGCDEGGAGQPHCAARYVEGGIHGLSLVLSPAENWHIDTVTGCNGLLAGNDYSIPELANDCVVIVTFAIDQYTLQYIAGTGGVIAGDTTQTIDHGADGSLVVAVAYDNYQFVGWSDGNTVAARTDTNVTADFSVTAEFAPSVDVIFEDRFE